MNIFRPSSTLSASLGLFCLAVVFCPVTGHAQQIRNRPAARPTPTVSPAPRGRPTPTPTPKPTPTPTVIPAAPLDPELKEQAPPSDAAPDAVPENETQIDASDGATFASKDRIATFTGNVRVNDPRFQLSCDKLTVFLNKSTPPPTTDAGAAGAAGTPAANGGTPAPLAAGNTPPPPAAGGSLAPDAKASGGGGGIDHCIAEGHVIILQKRAPTKPGEEEKVSIGRGEKGTFDNKSGDMVLTGLPEIEQNGNSHSATSPDTVMTIHRDSSLDTKGPSTTRLIQHKGSSGLELPGIAAPDAAGGKNKKKANGAAPAASPAASRASGQ